MKLRSKNLVEVEELLYQRMFTKWYSGNDKVFQGGFTIIRDERNNRGYNTTEEIIRGYLLDGYDVRTGYTCTRIRGVRNYLIFIKAK